MSHQPEQAELRLLHVFDRSVKLMQRKFPVFLPTWQTLIAHVENKIKRVESGLNAALAALVDLKEEIKHGPYFPVKSYSIKEVAPVCGFHWSQDDVDGQSAQLMYIDWLQTGDDSIIKRVQQYNREDVLAMLAVDRYVSALPAG